MNKKLCIFLAAITVIMAFSGCDRKNNQNQDIDKRASSSGVDNQVSDIEDNSSNEGNNKSSDDEMSEQLDEYGLPKMSSKNQAIYDKYIEPYIPACIWLKSFSKDESKSFDANMTYSCIVKPVQFEEVPQEIVEEEVIKYFPLTPQQLRSQAAIHDYDEEKGTYCVPPYQSSNSLRGVITSLSQDENICTIMCDWYTTVYTDEPAGTYNLYASSEIIINLETDEYISNKVTVK